MSAGHLSRRFRRVAVQLPDDAAHRARDGAAASWRLQRHRGLFRSWGTFERVQAGDAEVVQEPTEQPYGVRDCSVRDPAGNLIRIQELR
jgi:uncharacterized glyoxalase superfamily protein PhnB